MSLRYKLLKICIIFIFQSQGRSEIMLTLEKVIGGLGSAGGGIYKDIYKAAKQCMTDRAMSVRCSAAKVHTNYKSIPVTLQGYYVIQGN